MQYVPVIDRNGKRLMPCHPARARQLWRQGRAVRRFNKGLFYIRLTEREGGDTQDIAVGIDPGSKREGLTVKSEHHTYLNIQAVAVDWVKDALKTRRTMRRGRRFRKTPYRKCRSNRGQSRRNDRIPPSTKARWQWKLRLARWIASVYPVTRFIVEDIKATTRKGKGGRWNLTFSPLQQGKDWFYREVGRLAIVDTLQGHETATERERLGLKKTGKKLAEVFSAHCVDSWCLANWWVGGHAAPDNERMLVVTPLRFHRRQLHRLQPAKGGVRSPYGSTRSNGLKRGSLVKHPKSGLAYVGGMTKDRVSIHCGKTGRRLAQNAKPQDMQFLAFNSWRTKHA